MEKYKQKLKEIFNDKIFYLFGIITLLFLGIFFVKQFALDTYFVFTSTGKEILKHFFSCGRFVTGIAAYFFIGILHLNDEILYMLSYIFAVIFTTISMYKLYKLINKETKNVIICIIIAIFIVINIFSIELFIYIEKAVLMLSVLLCVMAVEKIDAFFTGDKKSIIWALIYMLIANCCYQGTVGLFVAISLVYIIKYSKNVKEFLINNVIVAGVYAIPALINFVAVRFVLSNSRVGGKIILGESLKKIIAGTKEMLINSYHIMPKYIFVIAIAIIFAWIIYKAIKNEKDVKSKILSILGAAYILVGTICVTIAPQILQNTNSIWFVARSSYSVAAIIGILMLYGCSRWDMKENETTIFIVVSVVFLLIQLISFLNYAIDGYIVDYEDKQNAKQIISVINNYEKETNNKVEKVAFYSDKKPNYTYSEILATGDINIKALYPDWSAVQLIQYYSGRKLKIVEKKEEIKKDFEQKDWDVWDKGQIVFEENIVHICNY